MTKRYYIGIDPGTRTGFAVWDKKKKIFTSLLTTNFWGAYKNCNSIARTYNPKKVTVVIEVPKVKKVWQGNKAAVDVGGVIREAKLLTMGIKSLGFNVITQHPQGKINHNDFKKITKWSGGRTNEHMRDAGMLVYGM